MPVSDKMILFFVFAGMLITFGAILAIVIDKYKKAEKERKEDETADAEEINQKILQMHDYGEFLSKELENKQSQAMLMYEMLLDKEKKLSDLTELPPKQKKQKDSAPVQEIQVEKNPFSFLEEQVEQKPSGHVYQPEWEETSADLDFSVSLDSVSDHENHNTEILTLYGEGHSEEEIAKRLQIGKGQVALVIRLFGK